MFRTDFGELVGENILPVIDAGVDEGLPYFAMMFVPGRSLSEVILDRSRSQIDPDCEVAAYVTLQVAYALVRAHVRDRWQVAGDHPSRRVREERDGRRRGLGALQ